MVFITVQFFMIECLVIIMTPMQFCIATFNQGFEFLAMCFHCAWANRIWFIPGISKSIWHHNVFNLFSAKCILLTRHLSLGACSWGVGKLKPLEATQAPFRLSQQWLHKKPLEFIGIKLSYC